MAAYYVKFKGLRGKIVVRERSTKNAALEHVEYLKRHNIKCKMGLIRDDGSLGKAQVST